MRAEEVTEAVNAVMRKNPTMSLNEVKKAVGKANNTISCAYMHFRRHLLNPKEVQP
jgi:hypothetical protein